MKMRNCFCVAICLLAFAVSSFGQDSLASTKTPEDIYHAKKRTAKNLIIGGSVGMGAGAILLMVATAQATADVVYVMTLNEPQYTESANTNATVGAVLFFGGTGVLIAGLITNGKANKMKPKGVTFSNTAPPVQIGMAQIPQAGFTVKIPIGKSR
jgi:hypothetical protein